MSYQHDRRVQGKFAYRTDLHNSVRSKLIWTTVRRVVGMLLVVQGMASCGAIVADDLSMLDNGMVRIGIDREKGGSITWLSWANYPENMVNLFDPGRLIQQSYYAGRSLDRKAQGQSNAWSPWPWNPIQGGGVGSWGRASVVRRTAEGGLYSETIPKLWDMPDEPARALMRQWTSFEPGMSDVIRVRCELVCQREEDDRWGRATFRAQEIPACYFTRNFSRVKSYLGEGKWRDESHPPGPPWGKTDPPLNVMALFEEKGQGVALFSPSATQHWNFGPHRKEVSRNPTAGPCMHVAPIDRVKLDAKSTYRVRYWLVVGDIATLSQRLDFLLQKYAGERAEFIER